MSSPSCVVISDNVVLVYSPISPTVGCNKVQNNNTMSLEFNQNAPKFDRIIVISGGYFNHLD